MRVLCRAPWGQAGLPCCAKILAFCFVFLYLFFPRGASHFPACKPHQSKVPISVGTLGINQSRVVGMGRHECRELRPSPTAARRRAAAFARNGKPVLSHLGMPLPVRDVLEGNHLPHICLDWLGQCDCCEQFARWGPANLRTIV